MVKNPKRQGKATIHYHDIGDYLTREQKLQMVKNFRSVSNIKWDIIEPTDKHDWINQRDGLFDSLILIGDKDHKDNKQTFFVPRYSNGLKTQRDAWCYNYSMKTLKDNTARSIDFFNEQSEGLSSGKIESVSMDDTKFSWTAATLNDVSRGRKYDVNNCIFVPSLYRPFCKQNLCYYRSLNERTYMIPFQFPTGKENNLCICVSGVGVTKDFSAIITNMLPDLELIGKSQCFPLYWYEENKDSRQQTLFDIDNENKFIRRDGVSDWILKEVRSRYKTKNISKEMIFYYVYGLLHSPDYRTRFVADLKKSLPRIPIVEDVGTFMDFYKAGKALADLHLNYEQVAPCPDCTVSVSDFVKSDNYDEYNHYYVNKMRFHSKTNKSSIIFNGNIHIYNIPAKAYDYIVNGKSAIEWIMERYCVSQESKSLIVNDANDWCREHNNPTYILDLLLSVINLSVQTVDIINALPKLKFE